MDIKMKSSNEYVTKQSFTLQAKHFGEGKLHFEAKDYLDFVAAQIEPAIVISRLAFHHFPDINRPFHEMARVLRPDGKLVLIDLEAPEDALRAVRDEMETLRDPSHVRNLSKEEMLNLYAEHSFGVDKCEMTKIPVLAENWLTFTETPMPVRQELMKRFEDDVNGKDKTGFYPYRTDKGICFHQKWILILGRK